MAIDRNAIAWVLAADGTIVKYDLNSKSCTPAAFRAGQNGFTWFGMGFSSDTAGGTAETLFVSDWGPQALGLAKIDTSSLKLSPIAQYGQLQGQHAELTGTGDGRLFGAFEGSPLVAAEIDKATAHIKSTAPQPGVLGGNLAFAFWGGDFWIFGASAANPGLWSDFFQYRPSTNTTTPRGTAKFEVVGAGVSTCAPTTPPQ
jgi:hypothetical protein